MLIQMLIFEDPISVERGRAGRGDPALRFLEDVLGARGERNTLWNIDFTFGMSHKAPPAEK